jgi:hypothetical protein
MLMPIRLGTPWLALYFSRNYRYIPEKSANITQKPMIAAPAIIGIITAYMACSR